VGAGGGDGVGDEVIWLNVKCCGGPEMGGRGGGGKARLDYDAHGGGGGVAGDGVCCRQ